MDGYIIGLAVSVTVSRSGHSFLDLSQCVCLASPEQHDFSCCGIDRTVEQVSAYKLNSPFPTYLVWTKRSDGPWRINSVRVG
jgi:hypothetical protein